MSRMMEAAIKLRRAGKSVLPTGKDKKPLVSWKEYQDQLPNESQIREWWTQWPDANIGMVTGKVSGLIIIDCDSNDATNSFLARFPEANDTLQVQTGRGRHFYFEYEAGIRNDAGKRFGEGIDVRAEGGFVVVPPSMHQSGKLYEYLNKLKPAPLPPKLQEILLGRGETNSEGETTPGRDDEKILVGYRNSTLTQIGGFLRRLGLGRKEIESALQAINRDSCALPVSAEEVTKIAESVVRYEPTRNGDSIVNPWNNATPAPAFLAQEEESFIDIAKDLLVPGAISLIAAPRGLGKTLVAHALAVALATGGVFRGEQIEPTCVLLVDRDNPPSVIKERLRRLGADQSDNLHVLTRKDVPGLTDNKKWELFPSGKFRVVIIDSLGSFTEGVTEKQPKEMTQVLATILDLAHKGIAVLILHNTTKDASTLRGRGELADRLDIIYEVRDATGFVPSGGKQWWKELPEAGEASWADRAARRKGRTDYRLAFTPSKFRLGPEPEPFCLEIHLPKDQPWSIRDVTDELSKAVEESKNQAKKEKEERLEKAANALLKEILERTGRGERVSKTEAEDFLKDRELSQHDYRRLITQKTGVLWRQEKGPGGRGKGNPQFLLPLSGPNTLSATELQRNEVTTIGTNPSGNKTNSVAPPPQSNSTSISSDSEENRAQEINSVTPSSNSSRPPNYGVKTHSQRPPSPRTVTPASNGKKDAWEEVF